MGLRSPPVRYLFVTLSLVAGALTAGVYLYFGGAQQATSGDDSHDAAVTDPWTDPLLENESEADSGMQENPRDVLGEDLAQHFESFFEDPNLGAQGQFLGVSQQTHWDESCGPSSLESQFGDLTQYVREQYGYISAMFPDGDELHAKTDDGRLVQVFHMNLYYRERVADSFSYFQVGIVRGSDPAIGVGYRVERYASKDPYLSDIIENSVIAPKSKRFDLNFSDATREVQREMRRLKGQVEFGTRTLVYGPIDDGSFVETVTIELTGGRITGFSDGKVSCEAITPKTVCSCLEDPNSNIDFAVP